jgi:hypothetical protein
VSEETPGHPTSLTSAIPPPFPQQRGLGDDTSPETKQMRLTMSHLVPDFTILAEVSRAVGRGHRPRGYDVSSTKPVRHPGGPRAPPRTHHDSLSFPGPLQWPDLHPPMLHPRLLRHHQGHVRPLPYVRRPPTPSTLQTLPSTTELDKFIRRMEEARGRLKTLDLAALEARWTALVSDARAKATPAYKDHHILSYNGYERDAAQLIRNVSDVIPFTRALDLLGAIHLLQIERRFFKTEESMACCTVELLRRTSRVGCKVVATNNSNGTITRSYRREMGKDSRLACAKMLTVALGAAAQALAKREAARAGEVKAVQADYWASVHA